MERFLVRQNQRPIVPVVMGRQGCRHAAKLPPVRAFPCALAARAWILAAVIVAAPVLAGCSGSSHVRRVVLAGTVTVRFRPGISQDTAASALVACRPQLGAPILHTFVFRGHEVLAARYNLVIRPGAAQKTALTRCLNSVQAVSSYSIKVSAPPRHGVHLI